MIVIEISPSRSTASSTSNISARSRLFSALRFSGRFSVMRRTRGLGIVDDNVLVGHGLISPDLWTC